MCPEPRTPPVLSRGRRSPSVSNGSLNIVAAVGFESPCVSRRGLAVAASPLGGSAIGFPSFSPKLACVVGVDSPSLGPSRSGSNMHMMRPLSRTSANTISTTNSPMRLGFEKCAEIVDRNRWLENAVEHQKRHIEELEEELDRQDQRAKELTESSRKLARSDSSDEIMLTRRRHDEALEIQRSEDEAEECRQRVLELQRQLEQVGQDRQQAVHRAQRYGELEDELRERELELGSLRSQLTITRRQSTGQEKRIGQLSTEVEKLHEDLVASQNESQLLQASSAAIEDASIETESYEVEQDLRESVALLDREKRDLSRQVEELSNLLSRDAASRIPGLSGKPVWQELEALKVEVDEARESTRLEQSRAEAAATQQSQNAERRESELADELQVLRDLLSAQKPGEDAKTATTTSWKRPATPPLNLLALVPRAPAGFGCQLEDAPSVSIEAEETAEDGKLSDLPLISLALSAGSTALLSARSSPFGSEYGSAPCSPDALACHPLRGSSFEAEASAREKQWVDAAREPEAMEAALAAICETCASATPQADTDVAKVLRSAVQRARGEFLCLLGGASDERMQEMPLLRVLEHLEGLSLRCLGPQPQEEEEGVFIDEQRHDAGREPLPQEEKEEEEEEEASPAAALPPSVVEFSLSPQVKTTSSSPQPEQPRRRRRRSLHAELREVMGQEEDGEDRASEAEAHDRGEVEETPACGCSSSFLDLSRGEDCSSQASTDHAASMFFEEPEKPMYSQTTSSGHNSSRETYYALDGGDLEDGVIDCSPKVRRSSLAARYEALGESTATPLKKKVILAVSSLTPTPLKDIGISTPLKDVGLSDASPTPRGNHQDGQQMRSPQLLQQSPPAKDAAALSGRGTAAMRRLVALETSALASSRRVATTRSRCGAGGSDALRRLLVQQKHCQ